MRQNHRMMTRFELANRSNIGGVYGPFDFRNNVLHTVVYRGKFGGEFRGVGLRGYRCHGDLLILRMSILIHQK